MKTSNLKYLILAAAVSVFCACDMFTKDYNEVFDESSSARTQAFIENTQKILDNNTEGWVMEYYPGSGQKYGGYAYVLKFIGDEVEVFSEIDTTRSCKSYYKFTTDDGPVLSFDVYNELLHYFATPSASLYQAMGGDFEFVINDATPEKIELIGKRSRNHYNLYPLENGMDPMTYVKESLNTSEGFRASILEGTIGDKDVIGEVDLNNRRITFTVVKPKSEESTETKAEGDEEGEEEAEEDEVYEAPFIFTPGGLRTYDKMKIGGCTFQDLYYLEKNNLLTNGVFTLKGKLPEDYTNYADFGGDFVLTYYSTRTLNVTLTPDESGKGYVMSGLNPNYTVHLDYDKARGRLLWNTQVVGTNGNNSIYLCAWDLGGGGNLTWSTDSGVTIYWDKESNSFKFEDNGGYKEDFHTDSFLLWEVNASNSSVGQFSKWGNGQIPYLESLKRK